MAENVNANYFVVLYYHYETFSLLQLEELISCHTLFCTSHALSGRVRLATEGINGTLGGSQASITAYIQWMQLQHYSFHNIDWKTSWSTTLPFKDLIIRKVSEIVSMEIENDKCPINASGIHLSPQEFHNMAQDHEKTILIDVRNQYEYNIGHFKGALNPETRRFGEFPEWCLRNQTIIKKEKPNVLMYCTGGIRCEKASSYMKTLGVENVYQLQGGIHRYMEAFPDGGLFHGKNFVFDRRVTVASLNMEIIGRCLHCNIPQDELLGNRCAYCRTHILLCPECTTKAHPSSLFCSQHIAHFTGTNDAIMKLITEYEMQLKQECIGRKQKNKRKSIRKKVEILHRQLIADNDIVLSSDQEISESDLCSQQTDEEPDEE